VVTADVHHSSSTDKNQPLKLELFFLSSGNIRFRLTERTFQRWQPTDLLISQGLAVTDFTRIMQKGSLPHSWQSKEPSSFVAYSFHGRNDDPYLLFSSSVNGEGGNGERSEETTIILQFSPLKVEVYVKNNLVLIINDRNLIHFEEKAFNKPSNTVKIDSSATVDRHKGKEVIDYGEDGLAIYADGTREEKPSSDHGSVSNSASTESTIESFGGHTDTVPHGHGSVGVDISFPCSSHVFGLPEHSTPLSLPTTTTTTGSNGQSVYKEPYRLYNLDVFEYELNEPSALYGNIPLLMGHGKCSSGSIYQEAQSVAVYFFNPSETFIDISEGGSKSSSASSKESHWMAESGSLDFFILIGPKPKDISHQLATLFGTQQLPPLFSLGYHQCRWNYRDEKDVAAVNNQFEALDFPYDVIWLDIEHTNGKRYFTVTGLCFFSLTV
jgi:alpha 1,3-glucosidase